MPTLVTVWSISVLVGLHVIQQIPKMPEHVLNLFESPLVLGGTDLNLFEPPSFLRHTGLDRVRPMANRSAVHSVYGLTD